MKRILLKHLLLGGLLAAAAPPPPVALESFLESCDEAGARLWGRSLCAPVVIVDPATGQYRTSRAEPGPLPPLRANTAFDWGGERWVMVLEPLPAEPAARLALLFHEAWHAHQDQLGFPANMAVAAHLEDPIARYLLRLEWRALAEALRSSGARRRAHAAQALAFRIQRLSAHPQAAEAEREQMRHEGLAAYTGVALSGDPMRLALAEIEAGAERPGLGRSFAYVSGPAWGLLLDRITHGWRERILRGGDLPDLVQVDPATVPRPDDYGGTAVLAREHLAAFERRALLAAAVHQTHESRALRLPLAQMSMEFDPDRVSQAPDGSSIYERIALSDRWGRITIDGSYLRIAPDFSTAFAPWPLSAETLDLADGWQIEDRIGGGAVLVRQE